MSDVKVKIPNFGGGVKYNVDPLLLPDNALADAVNFLPAAAQGGAEKVKVWRKDLLGIGPDGADDRIWFGPNVIDADSGDLAAADPFLPRFDNIEEVFYFYTNCFDDGATNYGSTTSPANVPLSIDGDLWVPRYAEYYPDNTSALRAGFYLYKDVILELTRPLCISVPVVQNGTYDASTHLATCEVYYIDGTQPDWASTSTATVVLGEGGIGRLEFQIEVGTRETARAGEYYIEITQATATPETDGYGFLGPITYQTGTNAELFGWAQKADTAVTGEAVTGAEITPTATLTGTGNSVLVLSVASSHTFTKTPVVAGTIDYQGTLAYRFGNNSPNYMTVTADLDAETVALSAPAWNVATGYTSYDYVSYSGNVYICFGASTGDTPTSGAPWYLVSASTVWSDDGLPTVTLTLSGSGFGTSTGLATTTESVTVDYTYASSGPLAELMVYQKSTGDTSYAVSANRLDIGSRYTRKNAGMPAAADVRTDKVMPIYALSDAHSIFALYQETAAEDTEADALMVGGAMLNTLDQYTRWRSASGTLSPDPIYYYLPKFIGEIRCFVNYQNRMVFGGVGGIAIFDPRNLLEGASKGKVNTPWADVIVPNIERRKDSQYLTDISETPTDVHPPVIRDMMVYGDDPGRVFAISEDVVFWSGGTTGNTVSNVYEWNSLAVFEPGDTQDECLKLIFFDQRGLIFTQRGDVYELTGVPPTDPAISFGASFQVHKIRNVGVIEHIVNTELGYAIWCDDAGNLYKMTGSLIPEPFGTEITAKANINIEGLRWDRASRRLWVHSGGYTSRAYQNGANVAEVTVSARSYVWDADTDSWWPVVNPMDEETRTTKPSVFRSGNVSWSAGYYFDAVNDRYTFTLECDIAGTDPLPLKNEDESLLQPENSTVHATESTAFLLTKAFAAEDHAQQVRYLQSLARLIDGTDCAITLVYDGQTYSLGTFNGSTDFATLAHKIATRKLFKSPRVNAFQIKLSITNSYADILRNLQVHVDLAGWPV